MNEALAQNRTLETIPKGPVQLLPCGLYSKSKATMPPPNSPLSPLRSPLATFLRPLHSTISPRSSHHTSSFSTFRTQSPTSWSHRPRPSSLLTTPRAPLQRCSMSSNPRPTNGATPLPHRSAGLLSKAWRHPWEQKGQRGMKVRSSVKKLCDGCKVHFPLFPVLSNGEQLEGRYHLANLGCVECAAEGIRLYHLLEEREA